MTTLYSITGKLRIIQEDLIDNGGELTPELEEALRSLEGKLEEKVERICHVIQNLSADADAANAEATRLRALASSRKKAADRLRDYLRTHLEEIGRTKVDCGLFSVSVVRNSHPSIRWTREDSWPDDFTRTTLSVDLNLAYDEWKASGSLPDGFSVEQGSHLRIR